MLDIITLINDKLHAFAWGPIMLVLLVGTGVYLTFRTGWIQVRWFGYILKNTVGTLFRKKEKDHGSNLSPFQAVTTALAGTVGTGNIAGYLTNGNKAVNIAYKVIFVLICILGAVGSGKLMWDIADTLNGLMAIPNLIALLSLSGVVAAITKEYFGKLKK